MPMTYPLSMRRDATFSPDRRWRYVLRRRWGHGQRLVMVMLNPSVADGRRDDPTTTFCVNRARAWGFGCYEAVNLFALVATDPRALRAAADPVGPANDAWIRRAARRADRLVVAWGNHGALDDRADRVLDLLAGETLWCFGHNRNGSPRFPRALPRDIRLRRFRLLR